MNTQVSVLLALVIAVAVSYQTASAQSDRKDPLADNERIDSSVLVLYRQYSSFTDPGEYKRLYANLPDSLPELCQLMKSQTIHLLNYPCTGTRSPKKDGLSTRSIRQ
jgi:hypothetical protein